MKILYVAMEFDYGFRERGKSLKNLRFMRHLKPWDTQSFDLIIWN